MDNKFVLSSGQAHELEMAFRRTGWDNAEVKVLCTGDKLTLVRDLINDKLEFKYKQPPVEFPVWKTIKIGTYKSKEALWNALGEDSSFKVNGEYMGYLFDKLSIAKTETKIELVKISTGELGLNKIFRDHNVYAQATKLGLYLLPGEVGFQLRLQYPDQPYGEELYVGMESVHADDLCTVEEDVILVVKHDTFGKGITTCFDGDELSANSYWLFGRRQY